MKIIGISLVKNEDIWIRRALENVQDFVDEHIVIDNGSTDDTLAEVAKCPWVTVERQPDLRKTHAIVARNAGRDVWLFGVDGDEIYDPAGLARMRKMMESGKFDDCWHVYGRFFHATAIDGSIARGYSAPPSKPRTKLYYMRNIQRWPEDGNHLFHGVRRKTSGKRSRELSAVEWAHCPLRCLHMRFLQRSSTEDEHTVGVRLAGTDVLGKRSNKSRGGYADRNLRPKYRWGEVSEIDTAPFLGERA